jgi:hypothetical protein
MVAVPGIDAPGRWRGPLQLSASGQTLVSLRPARALVERVAPETDVDDGALPNETA